MTGTNVPMVGKAVFNAPKTTLPYSLTVSWP